MIWSRIHTGLRLIQKIIRFVGKTGVLACLSFFGGRNRYRFALSKSVTMINNPQNRSIQYLTTVYVTLGMAIGSYAVNHWIFPMLPVSQSSAVAEQQEGAPYDEISNIHFIP